MKILVVFLLSISFFSSAIADDFPFAIGTGSDTVWFRTGIRPSGKDSSVVFPKFGVLITYGLDKKIESIWMSFIFPTDGKAHTLNGVSLGENRTDLTTKLGAATQTLPKGSGEEADVYEMIWVFKDQLLEVALWQSDAVKPDKHEKDTVAWVVLRKAYF